MDILVPGQPKRLRVTEGMIEDLLFDPVMAAKVIMGVEMDVFQQNRIRYNWWVPMTLDSSGVSSGKTMIGAWVYAQLRAILLSDQVVGVYFPTFQQGKDTFWTYYDRIRHPLFEAQIGYVGDEGESEGKARTKGPACFICRFRNGSRVEMPAPSILMDAETQASRRYNTLVVDEVSKVVAMSRDALDRQLIGRVTRPSWNQHHPIWGNHVKLMSTAEDMLHPAADTYRDFLSAMKRGDPDWHAYSYSFKDSSGLRLGDGRTFREVIRNERMMKLQKVKLQRQSAAKWLQEGLGIWAQSNVGWFTREAVLRCVEKGRAMGLEPAVNRREIGREDRGLRVENGGDGRPSSILPPPSSLLHLPSSALETHHFLGVDPALAIGPKSDDGAMVALRAAGRVPEPSDNLSDWDLAFEYARIVRRHSIRQWSGLIHKKDADFGFDGILMDNGAAGGGPAIMQELAKSRQVMEVDGREAEVEVTPILCQDAMAVKGKYILVMFRRGGKVGIEQLWPGEKGDDTLKDRAFTAFKEAVDGTEFAIPVPFNQRKREETQGWSEEKVWASKCLHQMVEQMLAIRVAMEEEQERFLLTARGARVFTSSMKDDLMFAGMLAYVRFLIWLRSYERWGRLSSGDAAGFRMF